MKRSNSILACALLSLITLLSACESTTAPYEYEDRVVFFPRNDLLTVDEHLDGLTSTYHIGAEDIHFVYRNAFRGASIRLNQVQISSIFPEGEHLPKIIPGEYIVMFKKPAGYNDWGILEKGKWTRERISEIQERHDISDTQIRSQYRAAISGFSGTLSDRQLAGLDEDERISLISPNVRFKAF